LSKNAIGLLSQIGHQHVNGTDDVNRGALRIRQLMAQVKYLRIALLCATK